MSQPTIWSRYLVPNCFDAEQYYRLDLADGVMRNRFGVKCCTFSAYALRGLYNGLKHETGPAWRLVMRRCGEIWGKRFAERFLEEIGEFYGESLDDMSMARFTALVEEYFSVSGWGRLRFDFSELELGVIQVEVDNEILGDVLDGEGERAGVLLEGVLTALFSRAVGKEMTCYETESLAQGRPSSRFLIGTKPRLKPVPAWIENGSDHEQVLQRLRAA